METNRNLVIRRDEPDDVIHGVVNFTAPAGLGVCYNPDNPDELIPATDTRAYMLVRDVVEDVSIEDRLFPPTFRTPVLKGKEATARRVREFEVEGYDLIIQSGTGAISSGTPAGTPLAWHHGRLRALQSTEELAGYLRAHLEAEDPENNGDVRILVELVY